MWPLSVQPDCTQVEGPVLFVLLFTPNLLFILHGLKYLFFTSASSLVPVLGISDDRGKGKLMTKSRGDWRVGKAWAERHSWSRMRSVWVRNPGDCEVKGNDQGIQTSEKTQTSWYQREKVTALPRIRSSSRRGVRFSHAWAQTLEVASCWGSYC